MGTEKKNTARLESSATTMTHFLGARTLPTLICIKKELARQTKATDKPTNWTTEALKDWGTEQLTNSNGAQRNLAVQTGIIMGHLSWQSLSSQRPLATASCRQCQRSPWTPGMDTLPYTIPPTPLSPPLFGYRGATRFALLLFDTQSSLPFNTLRKHIKWKFRARRPAPCFEWVVHGAVGERGWQTPKPCFIVRQPMQSAGICTANAFFMWHLQKQNKLSLKRLKPRKPQRTWQLDSPGGPPAWSYYCLISAQCSLHICHCVFFFLFCRGKIPASICCQKKIGLQAVRPVLLPFQVFYK